MQSKPQCVIADIDNTILLPSGEINLAVLTMLLGCKQEIIFLTCRPYSQHKETFDMLQSHGFKGDMVMRFDNDLRAHWEIKQDMLGEVQKKYDVLFAIDDQNSIIKMYQKNGINCLRVLFNANDQLHKLN